MKKVYFKPDVMVVAVNQRQALLDSSPYSAGPSSNFMSDPTISNGPAVKQNTSVWDEEW